MWMGGRGGVSEGRGLEMGVGARECIHVKAGGRGGGGGGGGRGCVAEVGCVRVRVRVVVSVRAC